MKLNETPVTQKPGAKPHIVDLDSKWVAAALKPDEPASLDAMNASRLFLEANEARRSGQLRDATLGYAEIVRRFPRDSRAGISAFVLGRIRMGELDDATGAAEAFETAIALGDGAGYREDALARLAIALQASGEIERCRRAKQRYLTEYPHGIHVGSLSGLCGR